MLWMRLRADDIAFSFDTEAVSVAGRDSDALHEALAWISDEVDVTAEKYPTPHPFRRTLDDGTTVGSRWRRLVGWYVDGAVLAAVYIALWVVGVSWWVSIPVSAVYTIGITRAWGRTLGMLATGIKVVDGESRNRPGWMQSSIRWSVMTAPWIASAVVGDNWQIQLILIVTQIAIYAPILWDQRGQGVHDLASRTMVVRVRRQARCSLF